MSQEQKKGFLDNTTTRREFLKLSGKGIAGTVVSCSLLSLFGYSEAEATGYALAKGLLIADTSRCTGCKRCEITCTMTNDGKVEPFISRVKVSRNYFYGVDGPKISHRKEDGMMGNFRIVPETCKQCKDPWCAEACPMEAIGTAPKTGARVVDTEKCVGCGMCTDACPWHIPTVDPETHVSTKCTLCNGDPTCAKNCPTGALKLIPWEEVKATLNRNGYHFA